MQYSPRPTLKANFTSFSIQAFELHWVYISRHGYCSLASPVVGTVDTQYQTPPIAPLAAILFAPTPNVGQDKQISQKPTLAHHVRQMRIDVYLLLRLLFEVRRIVEGQRSEDRDSVPGLASRVDMPY